MPAEAKGLLKEILYPSDLRLLDKSQLPQFCDDLRQFIIDNAAEHGGHFAASLGVVELTVALHYVFDTPNDQVVWDVGHQAYGHKILTGRRDQFHTNRLYKGVSPFPKRSESIYDTFGVGHSSTSISAALGMAVGSSILNDRTRQHVAVIGDGSLTGGMAFEALNNAGVMDSNVLVILNDNCMAIDPNVGALKEYLTDFTASKGFNKLREEVWEVLGKLNKFSEPARDIVSKMERSLKGIISSTSNLFESLKFRYFGPIDGHDVLHLVKILEQLKGIQGPKLLHISTIKGKGFELAEKDPLTWHAPANKFNAETGEFKKGEINKPAEAPKYQDVFGHTLVELAEKNDKIVGITPAMPSGCSMKFMMQLMPDRAFDVGICEQHAVTFSAGLATRGLLPFCNIYSTFMQRAYDQVVHDVALQNLDVVFCLDRGGIAGADGATHHGAFDIAYMRHIPNMIVSAPMNEQELRNLMYTAQIPGKGPFSIRYPRGIGVMVDWKTPLEEVKIGEGRTIQEGEKVAILTIGTVGNYAVTACKSLAEKGIQPAHYDLRFVKPLDEKLLHSVFAKFTKIVTIEDGCIQGGMGSAILEFMADNGYGAKVVRLGMPDRFVDHGTQMELHKECGYAPEDIARAVESLVLN
jgi:1-deoxy-D-xylulose-5-phosphate synthase